MNEATALLLDERDELKFFRDKFYFPIDSQGKPYIYLCGNSLGLQPKTTAQYIQEELEDWAKYGVEGHFKARRPWMPYHHQAQEHLAWLVGAKSSEVVPMNSLTVNLHLLMISFYQPSAHRNKILIEEKAFPSDVYAAHSQGNFHGYENVVLELPFGGSLTGTTPEHFENFLKKHHQEIALILLSGVNYYSGEAFDIQIFTKIAHQYNLIIGWDLAHAAGNLELKLHEWEVDFAAWCSYKYLNSGPGSISAIFIHEKHHPQKLPRLEGWWGHEEKTRFLMEKTFVPFQTAEAWQLSNPPILAIAPLLASLEIFYEATHEKRLTKSKQLTQFLYDLLINDSRLEIITPPNRGAQLSIRIKRSNAKSIFEQLEPNGVIADWREPDVIRVAPAPLYNSFYEIWKFSQILISLL